MKEAADFRHGQRQEFDGQEVERRDAISQFIGRCENHSGRHMQSRTIMADGIRMRWEEMGEGMPLVLIHDIPTSPALWRHVAPRIMGARCLAWAMVGHGASIPEGHGQDISVARQADYLLAWLDSMGSSAPCSPDTTSAAAWRRSLRCAGRGSAPVCS